MSTSPRSLPALARAAVAAALLLAAVALAAPASAQDTGEDGAGRVVDILELSGPLDPPMAAAIADIVADANRRAVEAVVLTIDAPAAVAVDVDDAVEPLLASEVPVVVWVGPGEAEAAGAAAHLVAAAHVAAAATSATVGPACPPTVSSTCDDAVVELRDDLVERRGADPAAWPTATALTAAQAADAGLVDLVVDGLEPLLVELDGREVATAAGPTVLQLRSDEVVVRLHKMGLLRRALHATLTPAFVYLLVVGALLLLSFELFQPGFGVAGVAGILLLPLAGYGLAVLPTEWWALAGVVAGMALLAVDLAIAGLGVPTAAGTALLTAGSWWLFGGAGGTLRLSPWLVAAVVVACVVFYVVVMTVVLRAQSGPDVEAVGEELVGRVGVVRSVMNPEGHVFVDGALWRARRVDDAGRVRTGTRVRVVGVDGAVLLVEVVPAPAEAAAAGPTHTA